MLDLDAERSVLVMTDAGPRPHLGEWLTSATDAAARDALTRLGALVGRLHAATLTAPDLARWHQPDVAATRLAIQYGAVGGWLREAGVADVDALGAVARDLGERWLALGGSLTVIDWELSTAGAPAQDLGHLGAHLWLLGWSDLWSPFTRGWRDGAGERRAALLAERTAADAVRHAACEVLARTVSAFADECDLREAMEVAADWLRAPDASFTG